MEDTSIPSHSTGNGHPPQNPNNHTRPFFYVHPPSQLYYYHWQFANPYGHYGAFPGTGVPFGRPYIAPYPYMPCPGYIVPHAPMQPIDYRRMFNPHLSPVAACDARFHQQTRASRETTTSETQTEARDAVSKLVVRLDKMRVSEEPSEENEQDSGVVSQTSGLFQHSVPVPSGKQQREDPETKPGLADRAEFCDELSPSSTEPLGQSTAARSVTDSSPGCLVKLVGQEAWSGGVDGVLPLDSSSHHEDSDEEQVQDELVNIPAPEKQHLANDHADCGGSHCVGNGRARIQPVYKPLGPQAHNEAPPDRLPLADSKDDLELRGDVPCPEKAAVTDLHCEPVLETEDLSDRILRLPCNELTTGGVLRRDCPLWPAETLPATRLPSGYLSTEGFLYSYYPSVAPERQSVLSPSLDELSSRDDMFSTDLDDVESVSGKAYVSDGLPTQVATGASDPGDEGDRWVEECPSREARLCAACGSCLNGDSRSGKSTAAETWIHPQNEDEVVEEEVEEDCDEYDEDLLKDASESWEVPIRKVQCPARHTQPPWVSRLKPKKAYSAELLDTSGLEKQEQSYFRGPECCEEHRALSKPDKCKGQITKSAQPKPNTEKQWGGERVAPSQENWESGGIKPRPKFWRPYPPRGKVRPARRWGGCKTFVPQRFRRDYNEEEGGEFTCFQRGRGSTKRRGARY
ncbi:hypothetical protein GJAV_G00091470 [Gymnothorax javanicus]|nr:hypothetical protein GJAV_G00091470 [Gymnothorax javanicus]